VPLATRGRVRAAPPAPDEPHPPQRSARHHRLRHGRPIGRRDRAQVSQRLVACGTVSACCTRCTTTPRRRAPVSQSASSRVG